MGVPVILRRMHLLLGTYVEVGVHQPNDATDLADSVFAAAFRAVEQVQCSLSFHDPDSELSQLNRARGRPVALSSLALRVLRLARSMTVSSDGLFNCTIGGALVSLGRLPDHGGIYPLLSGSAEDIELSAGAARLRRPVRITLDGIAKGYAVDHAILALRRRGIAAGWVNAGGDLRAFGHYTLPVRVRDHFSSTPNFGLNNAALASSATADQYDTAMPGEILAPNTLQPASGHWSVLARYAWRADALTKVAALAPPAQREQFLQRLGGRSVFLTGACTA